ncbi:hypothetical protein Tco_1179592 [Tanacetum coccineum]
MRLEHELRGRQKFEGKCAMQANWLKKRDAEIASLKDQLSLQEAEAVEAILLRGQIADVEVAEATRVNELKDLKEKNADLEGRVATLESVAASKDAELASSNSQLFKEQIEAVQDVQVKLLSDRVADLDAKLMRMALHLDEEFYPCYLTTIAGRRWILSRRLRLIVMKFLQSPEYLAAPGGIIGFAAYDPATEENYVAAVNALRAVDFPFLAQLASHKDSSMSDLMDLLCLEGPAAEAPKAEQLQPLLDQLMLPNHRLEDQVVIGETSLSFSLDLAYARVWKLKESAASRQLSVADALVPIVEPLSAENLIAGSIPPVSHAEAPPSSIVFKKEELETTPEHASAPAKLSALFCMTGLISPVHKISRSRLILKALSFCTMSTFAVLMVGMPISAGITAFVPYASENSLSPLLDLIMAIGLWMFDESKAVDPKP